MLKFSCLPSKWKFVKFENPQGSVLGPFFLIYINELLQGLLSDTELFTDTSLFSIVDLGKASVSVLNSNLIKTEHWAYQWKMSFNPDRAKQEQEVIFSKKANEIIHPPLYFNNAALNSHIYRSTLDFS